MSSADHPPVPAQSLLFEMTASPSSPETVKQGPDSIARVMLEETSLELDYLIPETLRHRIQLGSRVHVPLQGRKAVAVVVQLLSESPHLKKLRPITDTIGARPMFTGNLLKLAQWIATYYLCPVRQVLRTMLPEAVRKKPESFLSDSHISLANVPSPAELEKLQRSAPIQARIIELLQGHGGEATLSFLRQHLPRATQVIHILAKKGIVTRSEVRVERDPFAEEEFLPSAPLILTEEQGVVFAHVLQALEKPDTSKPMLLHGVTGSGKTEVYLQAIGRVLEKGKTALVLVPEISLTPQTIERFKCRFAERKQRIAVLHSHLSEGERHDEWYKIHEGRADIVIGARSAIFAPLENLGIIIVDEEQSRATSRRNRPVIMPGISPSFGPNWRAAPVCLAAPRPVWKPTSTPATASMTDSS